MATQKAVRLLRDPTSGERPPPDAFGVEPLAQGLNALLESVSPPFTISISGPWGIGKTTLTESVKTRTKFLAGTLDLWAEDVTQLRRSIVIQVGALLRGGGDAAREEVAKELDRALRVSSTLSEPTARLSLRDIGRRLANDPSAAVWSVAVLLLWILGFLIVANFVGGVAGQILGQLLTAGAVFLLLQSGLFLTISTTTEAMAPAEGQVELVRKFREFGTVNEADKRPVLMILDNLDRLTGAEAVSALSQIRSLVDLPGSRCIFLIPVDRSALARHLEGQLGDDEPDAARDFLDKFFNLDVVLTRPASLDIRGWARDQALLAFPGASEESMSELAQIIASAAGGSPRLVKRMLNGVAARYALLEESTLAGLELSQIALVESLVSRHPQLVESLALNPQALVDLRTALADAVTSEERTAAVDGYLSRAEVELPFKSRDELRDYLLQNEDVVLAADQLQTVLALREDRIWLGVPNAGDLKRALRTGEEDAFGIALDSLDAEQRGLALRAAIETVRELKDNGFPREGFLSVSAMAGKVAAAPQAVVVRRLGQEMLLTQSGVVLSEASTDLLYDGKADQRGRAVKERLVAALSITEPPSNASALMRALRNSAPILTKAEIETLQAALARFPDQDLTVLFDQPDPHVALLRGAVLDAYRDRLTNWTPGDPDQQPATTAAERLAWLDDQGPLDDALFEAIGARFGSLISSSSADAIPLLQKTVALLQRCRVPSSGIDALAQQLGQWPAEPGEGLSLAWRLPAQAGAMTAIQSATQTWLSAAPKEQLAPFVREHRSKLTSNGVSVAATFGNRFAATGDTDLAVLALEDDVATAIPDFTSAIEAIPSPEIYLQRVGELLAPLGGAPPKPDLLASLNASLERRIGALPAVNLAQAADLLVAISRTGTSVDGPLAALDGRVVAAGAGDLPGASEAAERVVLAKLPGATGLPDKVMSRSGALGVIHPATAKTLGRHPSTSRSVLRQALLAAVSNPANDAATLGQFLHDFRGKLRGDWRVTVAVVGRAASLPAPEARALLTDAKEWNSPPANAPERAEFDGRLTEIANAGLAPNEVLAELRG